MLLHKKRANSVTLSWSRRASLSYGVSIALTCRPLLLEQNLKGGRMWTQRECFLLAVLAICFKSLCTSLSYIFAAVTYSAVWSLVSSPVQTSLTPISSEPFLCESSRGTEERLHHTRLVRPSLLHAQGDTPVVQAPGGRKNKVIAAKY